MNTYNCETNVSNIQQGCVRIQRTSFPRKRTCKQLNDVTTDISTMMRLEIDNGRYVNDTIKEMPKVAHNLFIIWVVNIGFQQIAVF